MNLSNVLIQMNDKTGHSVAIFRERNEGGWVILPLLPCYVLMPNPHPSVCLSLCLSVCQWDSENIYLILEWCSGGDLSRFIRSRRILPERVARRCLQQIGTHTRTYTCMHILALTHKHICTCMHTHALTHTHMLSHTHTHAHTHACTHTHTHTHTYTRMHTHTCTHTHTHRHTHMHAHTRTHTHTHTHTHTYAHACTHTHTHTYACTRTHFAHTHKPNTQDL